MNAWSMSAAASVLGCLTVRPGRTPPPPLTHTLGTRKFLTFSRAWKMGPNLMEGNPWLGTVFFPPTLEPAMERLRVGTSI